MGVISLNINSCISSPCSERYGLLYNPIAASDTNIVSEGWHVSTLSDWQELFTFIGVSFIENLGVFSGDSLGYNLWDNDGTWINPPIELINSYGFNLRPAGLREFGFHDLGTFGGFVTSDRYGIWADTDEPMSIAYDDGSAIGDYHGFSIRLVKDTSDWIEGDIYIGNDGKEYPTIKIGNQVWISINLAETEYNNSTIIPYEGSTLPNIFTEMEWGSLEYGAWCAYDNNIDNVGCDFNIPT